VAVWPDGTDVRTDVRKLTRSIEPGESSWEIGIPDELLAQAKELFVDTREEKAARRVVKPAVASESLGELNGPDEPRSAGQNSKANSAEDPLGDSCRLIVKFTSETKDGRIPKGVQLWLSNEKGEIISAKANHGLYFPAGQSESPSETDGCCVWNRIEPGRYKLLVNVNNNQEATIKFPVLRSGQERSEHVVVPPVPTKSMLLVAAPSVPEDLRKSGIYLKGELELQGIALDGRIWYFQQRVANLLTFHPESGLVEQSDNLDLGDEAPQDRLLFLPAGPYRLTFGWIVADRENNQDQAVFPWDGNGPKYKAEFTVKTGENKWELRAPDGLWDAARKNLESRKK
jgi:hypothetical protein